MSRGASTTVDVAVFLVLVSAAAVTVATVPQTRPVDGDAADETAFVVATATATVEYHAGAGRDVPNGSPRTTRVRTAHGSLAGLLADAAFATATVDGRPLTPGGARFERAVRAAVRERLPGDGVEVVATWRPVRGSGVVGRTTVGPSPPPGADVAAATLSVGVPGRAEPSPNGTFRDVAAAVARAVVRGRFPPAAAGGGRREGHLTRLRYRHAAEVLGADADGPLRRGDAAAANRRLARPLTRRFATALRRRYDDPRTAAVTVSPDRVRVTVRRWSA